MKRSEILRTMERLVFLFGEPFFHYQNILTRLNTHRRSLVCSMTTENEFSFSDLAEAHLCCAVLRHDIKPMLEDAAGAMKPAKPLAKAFQELGVSDMDLVSLATQLKFLPASLLKSDAVKSFEVNDSGTNLQWYLINLGFGNLVTSDFQVLNKNMSEIADWLYDRLNEVEVRIAGIMKRREELFQSMPAFALATGNLLIKAQELADKWWGFLGILTLLASDVGVTIEETLACVNDVD